MSTLRWALLALAVLTLLVVASLTADSRGWSQDVLWSRGRLERLAVSAHGAPVLAGDALAGNPGPAYRAAGRAMGGVSAWTADRLRTLLEREDTGAADALALVADIPQKPLQKLRVATQTEGLLFDRSLFGRRTDWDPAYDLLPLVDGVLLRSRFGNDPAARVDDWLMAMAAGADLSGLAMPIGKMMGAFALERVVAVADARWLADLPESERRRLADALARVEPTLPVELDLAPVLVDLVALIERGEPKAEDIGFANPYRLWQYGFSAWHAGVERVGRAIDQLRAFEAATPAGETWPARRARLQALQELDERLNPDQFWRYFQLVVECEEGRRTCVAGLRRLRVAVAESLGEEPPLLDDPLR